ncbi:hypothetical protein [Flavobacterium rhizosphaerae]|uniref:Uncharacterized protein n=1 Tax=Flavobacterium rhizosphaerae TaxID=3163298 RepID=A0ABW8YWT4_9FLAO
MHIEGGKIEGFKYGGLSPLDFSLNGELAGWWRATDGVQFLTGNYVDIWRDISGYGRDLVSYTNNSNSYHVYMGRLENTQHGVAIGGGDGSARMLCPSDTAFKTMFYDGRPITIFIVFKCNYITGGGFNFIGSTDNVITPDYGRFTIAAPTTFGIGMSTQKWTSGASTNIADNRIPADDTAIGAQVISLVDLGYNATSSTLHRKSYLNNVLKKEQKFSQAPGTGNDGNMFTVTFGGRQGNGTANNHIYEIIIYDNTGKSQAQILDEHARLYNEYINIRYPNLYT